ncbi:hypothetical protein GE21DRAFT_1090465 [Neurospora crassa]|nr:hypothetical protein GE21DRAFT_1090465 [Neurospora crassa]
MMDGDGWMGNDQPLPVTPCHHHHHHHANGSLVDNCDFWGRRLEILWVRDGGSSAPPYGPPERTLGKHGAAYGEEKGLETLADSVELAFFFSLTARNGASRSLTPYPHIHDASIGPSSSGGQRSPSRAVESPRGKRHFTRAFHHHGYYYRTLSLSREPVPSHLFFFFFPSFVLGKPTILCLLETTQYPPFLCLKYNTNSRISYQLYSIFYCLP